MTDNSEYIDYERTHTNNTWGRGIKDPNERQIAYQAYCDHISQGKFKHSWKYVNKETGAHWTYETIEKWIRDTDEFATDEMKVAEASGFSFYEKQLIDSITGENTKVNIAGLQMAMRNKYGWDKQERREVNVPEVLASYERVMLLLSDRQKASPKALESAIIERIEIAPSSPIPQAESSDTLQDSQKRIE
jgi:hypothetical protein